MSTYVNNDERFGFSGPFEAESLEALADGMDSLFQQWADEAEARDRDNLGDIKFDRAGWVAQIRDEFIAALEEVDA